jgi:DNA-binding IclR family transcriptional regulator
MTGADDGAGLSVVGSEPPQPTAGSGRVQSVDRAMRLLDSVAAAGPHGETVAGLAVRCDLNRATAWRLLATLEAHGMVERDPATNRYSLGLALLRLSGAAGYDTLARRSRPVLERVSRQTGETADLAAARRDGVTYISEVAPPSVLAVSWLARDVPLHATSTGKAYLAWLDEDEVRGLLESPLSRYTDTTITNLVDLMDDLAQTRERGYAQCAGELEPTLFGVSAPILGVHGRPVAVFSVWGPLSRVPASRFPLLGPVAIEAAAEVQALMTSVDRGLPA